MADATASRVRVGEATVTHISDGRFRLDGGAMYGVVPRVLWEQRTPADEKHRIRLAFNAVLVEHGGARILIDPGLGDRYDARFAERYAVQRPPAVLEGLRRLGLSAADIDLVVDTHLHWDHAGANTGPAAGAGAGERLEPLFPRARYVVQRREWEEATRPHERNRASYRPDDFLPLAASGRLWLVDGDVEVAPGVRVLATGGHTAGMQLVRVDSAGAVFLHLADLVPTRHHLDPAWIMGFDLYPVETLHQKQRLLPAAADGGWVLGFVHDPEVPFGTLRYASGRPVLTPTTDPG